MTNTSSKSGKGAFSLALSTVAAGIIVLLGWVMGLDVLKSIVPGMVAMNPATAIVFILAGASLAIWLRASPGLPRQNRSRVIAARFLAMIVATVGLIKLVGYLVGFDVGIDQILFSSQLSLNGHPHPNRLAPNTALSFLLLGIVLAGLDANQGRVRFWVQLFIVVLSVNSLLSLLGYAYGVQTLYSFRGFSPMALVTGICFLMMCAGLFLSQTDAGLLAILAGKGGSSSILRRLLPAAILIPAGLGWLTLQGERVGIFQDGEVVFALGTMATFTALICWTSVVLFRAEGEREKAENALRLLNSAVVQSKESILITTADLDLPGPKILFCNPAFTKMTGYSQEEVLGKTPRILQGPLTDREVLKQIRKQLEAGEACEAETINYRKNGESFALEWQMAPITNPDGKLTNFIGIQRDVTDRRKAQQELLLSEQRYRSLVEATTAIVWNTPSSGEFQVEQPAWTTFTGQSFAELRGWGWLDAVHPDDQAETTRLWSQAVATRSIYKCEHRLRAADGSYHNMMVRAVPILSVDGEIVHFIGIHSDITGRKRTEARYRRLVESNAQGVIFWNRTGKITEANDAFLKLVGYSRHDLDSGLVDWIKLTPLEHANIDQQALEEISRQGFSSLYEKEFIRKDGSRIPVLYGAATFEDSPDEGVCFVLDLTDRKKLEQQLFQSQKMETVGKLAGSIAHEFNSILTAIIGQSELMQHDLGSTHLLFSRATEINKAALRAAVLTQQILAYGRKQLLQPEALDLNVILHRMTGTLEHLMGPDTGVRTIPGLGLKMVKADVGQIEQVIINIALNARDAMPHGGKLTLETNNITFGKEIMESNRELKPGDYVMLAITDTGIGMTHEVLKRIFDPFFSTKEVGQGTGLGLSTCYGIIKQSGGHISAYAEPAKGTVFKIYLPQIQSEKPVRLAPPESSVLPCGTETILIAEDDISLLEMSADLLRRLGYHVLAAGDGIKALEIIQQTGTGPVDLLITDVVMPHMSGKELSDKVKSIHPATKVLFTSAYTENAIIHQGFLSEGITLLQKPFAPAALAQRIREVLDRPKLSL
jgi:two-component system cell cycle sensor histidine kinase/response regulator CckA